MANIVRPEFIYYTHTYYTEHKVFSGHEVIIQKYAISDTAIIQRVLHLPCCHYHVSCIASLPFINPLPWPHGIVKCPSYAHFAGSEYFFEYCEFEHTYFV